jgi:ATP-binding cassette, subfamily B, bacterial
MRVPLVIQAGPSDCGAACVAMITGAVRGARISIAEVDALRNFADRDGMSVLALCEAFSTKGLATRAVRVTSASAFGRLVVPLIALCKERHYIVVEACSGRYVQVCDPSIGKKRLRWSEFEEQFAGVAVVLREPVQRPTRAFPSALVGTVKSSVPYRFAKAWPHGLRYPFLAIVALSIGIQAANVTAILILRSMLQGRHFSLVSLELIALGMIGITQMLGQVTRGLLVAHCNNAGESRMREDSFRRVLTFDFTYFQYRPPGYLGNVISNTRQLNDAFFGTVIDGTMNFILGLTSLCVLVLVSWFAGVIVAAAVGLVFSGTLVVRRRISSAAKVEFEHRARLASMTDDVFRGIEGLHGIEAHAGAGRAWSVHSGVLVNSGRVSRMWSQAAAAVVVGWTQILQVGVIALVVMAARSRLGAGDLIAVVGFSGTAFTPLLEASRRMLRWGEIDVLLTQLSDVWDRPAGACTSAPGGQSGELPATRSGRRTLALSHVQVGFGNHPPLIKDATFCVRRGERVGISAPSGAGKTTLLRAVSGMIPTRAGTISVDGVPIAEARASGFRLAYVPQDVPLLAATIAENLRVGAVNATDEEIWQACGTAQIAEDIRQFPNELGTMLATGGAGLSGGQRQRLAIARALLTRPWLLILDEATSALDYVIEEQLFSGLAGMTLLVVSHRREVMRSMDRILTFVDGEIREDAATTGSASATPVASAAK